MSAVEDVTKKTGELVIEDVEAEVALPPAVAARVAHLKTLQEQQAVIEAQFEEERRLLELKYEKLYQPLYDERALVVTGEKEVASADEKAKEAEPSVGIPKFWVKALMNHPMVEQMITDRDIPALEFLKNVKSESLTETNGFRLEFHFAPNEFFTNDVLTKVYDVAEGPSGDAMLKNIVGTPINWNEGKNCARRRRRSSRRPRTAARRASFFQFFSPVEMPTEDEEEESDEIMHQLDTDFQIGFTIHETIVPQAVLWFTGEAEVDESDYEDDEDDEDYDDEDLSDDDDDDDEPRAKKGGKKAFPGLEKPAGAESTEKPPECKNQ
ncbi:hypothetical protein SPRG_05875 [Saprolegnia parasitica CBS 223.65]|uniref:Nucleosome assembly protein n=1 Tax=Saprolegnia parasitica (strain CBS 223.65) TaxID=695850 RepID=A0A067CF08_SAPPC|nr:hypothetical protein SPRG_05875 [Saprolegnia parasitica CBS 223.65]KDO29339.1 hypothetical protein SPRG_05875 [Saprolegnia parasitica CBS 223.65]|eukprot:XP_012199842.1 hypothetical protein SPRG_05875 [Saprolegnia parasitica CBS 223.65]